MPSGFRSTCSGAIASRSLCASTKAILYWESKSRLSWSAATPLAPFTKIRFIFAVEVTYRFGGNVVGEP
jgi:hypothetical protein